MPSWIGYTPDMWKSGHEPMTGPQTRYLGVMSNRNRIQIPFIARTDSNGQRVTKAEASTLLTKFEKGERVDASFIDELGRGEPGPELGHPSTWWYCHEPATENQVKWIEQLTGELGIPLEVTQKGTLGITRGQASELIKLLRIEKGEVPRKQRTRQWLDDAVTASVEEVPLPDEVEGVDIDYDPDEDDSAEEGDEEEDEMEVDLGERMGRRELKELLADAQPELMQLA
ncbi:hypothetical protein OH76DRAFT_1399857 [Lentinus brumalis]|uniref:Uncharacterized protein n=1 Tax=Lentinus brumalis TaxID=2498619 RepID=A0A371DL18_9APHY|nr:hypothetical protein OH76DRAFT_1399857 [Polyporus brumalis]